MDRVFATLANSSSRNKSFRAQLVLLLLLSQGSGEGGEREHLLLVSFLLPRLRLKLLRPETLKLGFLKRSPDSLSEFRVKENRGWAGTAACQKN